MSELDEAYTEVCQENELLKARLLDPAERGYVLGLLKEHLEYYRTLAGNGKASEATRGKLAFLEKLWLKLV